MHEVFQSGNTAKPAVELTALCELLKTEEPSNVDSVRSSGARDTHNGTLG